MSVKWLVVNSRHHVRKSTQVNRYYVALSQFRGDLILRVWRYMVHLMWNQIFHLMGFKLAMARSVCVAKKGKMSVNKMYLEVICMRTHGGCHAQIGYRSFPLCRSELGSNAILVPICHLFPFRLQISFALKWVYIGSVCDREGANNQA